MANYSSYNEDKTQKVCSCCKLMKDLTLFRRKEKRSGRGQGKFYNNVCKDCEHLQVETYRTTTKKGLVSEIIRRKKSLCKKENLPFNLTKDWVLQRLEEIGWRCELTGIPMKSLRLDCKQKLHGFNWNSVSLDRINPASGYVKENVRFVLNQVNIFRQNGTDEQMYLVAEALLRNRKIT